MWIGAGAIAIALGVAAFLVMRPIQPTTNDPTANDPTANDPTVNDDPRSAVEPTRSTPALPQPPRIASPPGLRLGDGSEPGARSKAQAIADSALEELRRFDEVDVAVAREIYMRGHAALERVEDELPDDDEPGRAKLRADTEALRDEMARLFKP